MIEKLVNQMHSTAADIVMQYWMQMNRLTDVMSCYLRQS